MSDQQRNDETRGVIWRFCARFIMVCVGIGVGGFFFCFLVAGQLSTTTRPTSPEPDLGYTHLIKVMHSGASVYVTYFEYLVRTQGFWATWGFAVLSCVCSYGLGLGGASQKYPKYSGAIMVWGTAAVFCAFMYLMWHEGVLR